MTTYMRSYLLVKSVHRKRRKFRMNLFLQFSWTLVKSQKQFPAKSISINTKNIFSLARLFSRHTQLTKVITERIVLQSNITSSRNVFSFVQQVFIVIEQKGLVSSFLTHHLICLRQRLSFSAKKLLNRKNS